MDFSFSERAQELRARAREFVRREVMPLEPRLSGSWKALEPALREARARARSLRLWVPDLEVPLEEFAVLSEELGHSPLGHYCVNAQAPDIGNMELLELAGSKEQKERWLRPLRAGEIRSCFSMTEPEHAGSNPTWMDTRAVLEGGQWVVDGHKWFTSAADGAAFAVVMAVTDPDAPPHLRASMIIVPCDTAGFELVRNIPVMGHAGEGWPTHSEIRYTRCRVPEESLLGGRGAGFALAQERLGPGRIHHCMRWIGICERAFELMCQRAAERELAPGKPLATQQTVQQWIADSRASIDAARLMVLHAAWKMERVGQREARVEISTIKFFVANVLQDVLDKAVQVHGALGVTDDTPLAYWYRHERAARIYDGPDEVHKTVVARRVLRGFGVEIK
ncbi:MAG: acyl-CoA dehydrogenase [Deltaproteobacteria bacterium]|nr:MAG: acyl-CoA dehydrogenase [Deltaproteobacteria bacterium]TMB32969.1 MAG: acyl-CoA dehydrogenase [Deltaproteobacteria bacterium]